MAKINNKAFTLVELLAVIVILAVILVIAVPSIISTINESRKGVLESSAKLIASTAESMKLSNNTLGVTEEITCSDVAQLTSEDYDTCKIDFVDGDAYVSIIGKGKFEGMAVLSGTVEKAEAIRTTGLELTDDGNIRYVGANPNNYVEFNGEAWRIIGVFGSNLKLVRDEILTTYSFDNKTTAQGIDTNYGTNDWSNSYLREFLNDYYYDGKTITCHSDSATSWVEGLTAKHETITCPDINKINTTAKNMIQKTTWNLGGTTWKIGTPPYETYPVNELYTSERGTQVYSKHATTSTDYIGLIYPSDYGYASTDASCRQNLRAGVTYTNNASGGTPTCKNNNWLFNGTWYWTISPNSSTAYHVFYVGGLGDLNNKQALYRGSVRPSVYLKSNVSITSGEGTSSNPYKLSWN